MSLKRTLYTPRIMRKAALQLFASASTEHVFAPFMYMPAFCLCASSIKPVAHSLARARRLASSPGINTSTTPSQHSNYSDDSSCASCTVRVFHVLVRRSLGRAQESGMLQHCTPHSPSPRLNFQQQTSTQLRPSCHYSQASFIQSAAIFST